MVRRKMRSKISGAAMAPLQTIDESAGLLVGVALGILLDYCNFSGGSGYEDILILNQTVKP